MLTPLIRQPVVSTANIAQLAVDLLIASLSLRVIGVFDSRNLVPVVGGREDEAEGISTPLECELRAHPPPCNLTQRFPCSVWKRRVRHRSHSTAVTRIGGKSRFVSRPNCVPPNTSFSPSPAEKARVYRCTPPLSPGITALCNSFFVWRRHVQQDGCTDDVRDLHIPIRDFVGTHGVPQARPRTSFAHQILHLGIIHHYPPSLSFPFQNIHHLLPSTPELHRMKGLSPSSPAVASRGESSLTFLNLGEFQQPHFFSSCLKVTIVLTRRSWLQLWPRYFRWRYMSGGYQTAGDKGYSELLMTRRCMVDDCIEMERKRTEFVMLV